MNYVKISGLISLVVLVSCTFNQSYAQSTGRAGIKGGLNVSNLYIDQVNDENARIGAHFGLYAQVFSSDVIALQTELLFSTRGSLGTYTGFFNQEIKYNLSYIDLPVLAVIKVGENVEFHAGAYGSYLIGANISYEGDVANGVDEIDRDQLKSYDYGLAAGVGINVGAVQIGMRYNYGLVEIADSQNSRALLGDAKNSCAQLFAAFSFGGR